MLVDNSSVVNILYWNAYQKTELMRADLSPMTIPLYGFTGDHAILEGTIKLAVTLGEHPRVAIIVTKFLTVNCLSAFNGVIGKPLLRSLKATMSVHYLLLKFPTATGTGQV